MVLIQDIPVLAKSEFYTFSIGISAADSAGASEVSGPGRACSCPFESFATEQLQTDIITRNCALEICPDCIYPGGMV